MKRVLRVTIIIAVVVIGFFAIREAVPFMAIQGTSMEPELKTGDLVLIEEVSPSEVEVGDIIVYTVPAVVREAYDYPEVVAHRVVSVYTTESGTTFRTKGDNVAAEEPFVVRAEDLKGQVSKRIPYIGFPLLFFAGAKVSK